MIRYPLRNQPAPFAAPRVRRITRSAIGQVRRVLQGENEPDQWHEISGPYSLCNYPLLVSYDFSDPAQFNDWELHNCDPLFLGQYPDGSRFEVAGGRLQTVLEDPMTVNTISGECDLKASFGSPLGYMEVSAQLYNPGGATRIGIVSNGLYFYLHWLSGYYAWESLSSGCGGTSTYPSAIVGPVAPTDGITLTMRWCPSQVAGNGVLELEAQAPGGTSNLLASYDEPATRPGGTRLGRCGVRWVGGHSWHVYFGQAQWDTFRVRANS